MLILTQGELTDQSSFFPAGRVSRSSISAIRADPGGLLWIWRGVSVEFHHPVKRHGLGHTNINAFLLGRSADAVAYDLQQWLKSGPRQ